MPNWLQAITSVIPLLYILSVIRGIILKGVGLEVLRLQMIALAVFGAGIVFLAASRFEKRLE
jgi:ABC-2 type transport system permease protein